SLPASTPRFRDGALRPWEHGSGRLVDSARRPAPGHKSARGSDLATSRTRRPDPRRLRSTLVALAEPESASDYASAGCSARSAAALLARAQAHRIEPSRTRLLTRLPALSCNPVDDVER